MAGILVTIFKAILGKPKRKTTRRRSTTTSRRRRTRTEDLEGDALLREVMRRLKRTGNRRALSSTELFKQAVQSQGFSRSQVNSAVSVYKNLTSNKSALNKTLGVASALTRDSDHNGRADIVDFASALWDKVWDDDDDEEDSSDKKEEQNFILYPFGHSNGLKREDVMHIHILGICGTFMGGIAVIAKQLGHKVTGSDANVYPPMSTMLEEKGIEITEGFDPSQLKPAPDLIVVGNAMKRGNPCVEYMLNEGLPFTSGPEWLEHYVLNTRKVIGVAGTHGKTSTSSMVAWILEKNGLNPSFLIGGVPGNFNTSARIGADPYFVIESDEYDCAFFDKRSKFVHYRPYVQILNNLEYDHADIFENVAAIQKQFHHLVRIIPEKGAVIVPAHDHNLDEVIEMGCWSHLFRVGAKGVGLYAELLASDGSDFNVFEKDGEKLGELRWSSIGLHNVNNALMAIEAARYIGIAPKDAIEALSSFVMPKRRMELKGTKNGVTVYDDFAHHPTAIKTTLDGLRKKVGNDVRIIAVFEPRSNTMKMGVNHEKLADAFKAADKVFMYAASSLKWNTDELELPGHFEVCHDFDNMLSQIVSTAKSGDVILVMSNGGFNGIQAKLLEQLQFQELV